MAPHSSTLAWKIPWTKEPGRLQSMESQRVGHKKECYDIGRLYFCASEVETEMGRAVEACRHR